MAAGGLDQPLLTEPLVIMRETNQEGDPKRRRLRRSKSAPSEFHSGGLNERDGHTLFPQSKFHPSIRNIFILLVLYLATCTICFYLVRHQIEGQKTTGVLDSIYFCIVTITTLGYGDLVPNTVATKLLSCVFIFFAIALVGLTLSNRIDYLVEKQEILLIEALNVNRKFGTVEALKVIQTTRARNECIKVFISLLVLIIVGIVFLATIEKLDIVDALYCVCSTITTLGYGNKSFSSTAGRAFAVFWILLSTICLAQFLFTVAELSTGNRHKELVKSVLLATQMKNADPEASDLDDDGMVSAAELTLYKLREMRSIN